MEILPKITRALDEREITKLHKSNKEIAKTANENADKYMQETFDLRNNITELRDLVSQLKKRIEELENERNEENN